MTTRVYIYDPTGAIGAVEISSEVYSVDVSRGRSRELDEINPGTCTIGVGTTGAYGVIQPGLGIVVSDGDSVLGAIAGTIGIPVYFGYAEDIDFDWRPGRFAEATLSCLDGLGRLARSVFLEWTTSAGDTPFDRFTAIRARSEVEDAWTSPAPSLDTGTITLQSDVVDLGTNVLSYCQQINKAEQGRFFVAKNNQLIFQDYSAIVAGASVVTFRDDATGSSAGLIPFSVVDVRFGAELLYTKVTVENVGGIAQTVDQPTQQANFGIRHLTFTGMLMENDTQAHDLAQNLLGRYSAPDAVINKIAVPLEKLSSTNRETVTGIEIGDTVDVIWTPTVGLGQLTQTLLVEGVGYSKSTDSATTMTFQLSSPPPL